MSSVVLTSPLRGWASTLDDVPDPVFSGRMLGDGVAIEPTGSVLHAPCDAEVVSLHAGRHAITLRTYEGAELLMHIGVDTVALSGKGFHPQVSPGDRVLRGDPLIEFDLKALLGKAPSLITPILVNNPDRFEIQQRDVDQAVAVGQRLMTLTERTPAPQSIVAGEEHRRQVMVPMVHGVHARPAGRIAECARQFEADISVDARGRSSNARSAVSLLTLGVKLGDTILVRTVGRDAADALTAICELIESGMGEGGTLPIPSKKLAASRVPLVASAATAAADGVILGVKAAPGYADGRVVWLRHDEVPIPENGETPDVERARLASAIEAADARLAGASGNPASIMEAHQALLADPELRATATKAIDQGRSAEHAWRAALRTSATLLRGLGDARLAERADDLLDVERQVIAILSGREAGVLTFPPDTILLAEDLLPSELIRIGAGGIAGFCTVRGGPTSHVAILAAGMGIPGVVAAGLALAEVENGTTVILDAETACLRVNPNAVELEAYRSTVALKAKSLLEAMQVAKLPATTTDGVKIEVFANLASEGDARTAVANGAEGCGLLRTEFLFLDRANAPDEVEQASEYQRIADALDGRPMIVRLLDIGGDKPAPYLPIATEENPALGLRGIRVGLAYPDVLAAQLRAILRVQPVRQCRIMIPMVASVAELLAVRASLNMAQVEVGLSHTVELGVMIETPAAAVTADLIAAHADFLSIGTNDLTQYVLAMDRGNSAVAAGIDPFHPAVLRMVRQTCDGGAAHGKWTGMCGGLASDPLAAPILIGLGIQELSVTPALVPEVKAAIRAVGFEDCKRLADEALLLPSAQEVRSLALRFVQERA